MNTNLVKMDNSRVKLTVDINAESLEKAVDEAYRRMVKNINIPGFRKGKAPRQIIEMTYGPDVFLEEAIDILLPRAYEDALRETKIQPVAQPQADIEKIARGEGATFTFEVDVYPELQLGEYKGLKASREKVSVTDEDVQNVLEQQRQRGAELVVVEDRPIQEGDFAVIDFIGYVDGQPFSGGAGEDHTLEIGSGQFIPGFEEQLVGSKVGETKDVNVTFPEEYHADELAGKEAVFKVVIKELKQRSLPELDDEFAKDISEHETLSELKEDIRKNLEDDAERRTTAQLENTLLELIADGSSVEIPQSMIEHQAEHLMEHFFQNMLQQGINEERYLEITGQSKEDLIGEFRPNAEIQIMHDLIIDAVAEREGITVTEEEVSDKIDEFIGDGAADMEPELQKSLRQYWESQQRGIELSLLREKTLQFIVDNAQISEVDASEGDVEISETE